MLAPAPVPRAAMLPSMKQPFRSTLLALSLIVSPALATGAFAKEPAKPKAATAKPAAKKADGKKADAKKPDPKKPDATKSAAKGGGSKKAAAGKGKADKTPGPLADFGGVEASADVVHIANFVSYTHDNFKKDFVIIDKKAARMYVFDRKGKLKGDSPILLGKAVGDYPAPGIGTKAFKDIKDEEMTTPAGRFFARPGVNNRGERIIWIDYDLAVSMHRMRTVDVEQKRAERMDTPEADDNRISYGCVNVPAKFYDTVLSPAVRKPGAFVYVLPETKTARQFFGTHDVPPAGKG